VIGQADGPLLDRQLDRALAQAPVLVELLQLLGAPEHERARVRRVGEEVVHSAIARLRPAHAARADRAARQQLPLVAQADHHLARGSQPPPELEHPADRVAHLLVGRQRDPPVLPAVKPDRQTQLKLAASGLVAQPTVKPLADQVQLRLGEQPLEPQQRSIVVVTRAVDRV
jgi:hypothetical protein